jgi:hypothetical protein
MNRHAGGDLSLTQYRRSSRRPSPRTSRRPSLRWLLLCALALGALVVAAKEFDVTEVQTRLIDDTYVMDARIDYGFSERALEALDNGVPLTLEVHVQVRPVEDWIWDDSLVDQRLRYRIQYKPLSERYLVTQLPDDQGRSYVTRDAALAALGELNDVTLVSVGQMEPDIPYEVHIRVALDIEELPLPLRPMAYLYPSWKQSSNWSKWPLTP